MFIRVAEFNQHFGTIIAICECPGEIDACCFTQLKSERFQLQAILNYIVNFRVIRLCISNKTTSVPPNIVKSSYRKHSIGI